MTELTDKIKALVELELQDANVKHPQFHSLHEGYSVLLEKIEEASEALEEVEAMRKILWIHVRRDDAAMARSFAARLEKAAAELAAEAVQCSAMARKMLDFCQSGIQEGSHND